MKTRRFCPHCGRPLQKSNLTKEREGGYTFQCFACDENFFKFEVLRKKDLDRVKKIRKWTIEWEKQRGYHPSSVYKPYPRWY